LDNGKWKQFGQCHKFGISDVTNSSFSIEVGVLVLNDALDDDMVVDVDEGMVEGMVNFC
jgi:hypothetical protein